MTKKDQTPEKSDIEKRLEKKFLEAAEIEEAGKQQPAIQDFPEVTRDPSAVSPNRGHENPSIPPEDEQTAEASAVEAGRESAESELRGEGRRFRE